MPATIVMAAKQDSLKGVRAAVVAWVLTSVYYFYQYALRSAPAVMMPELSNAFGITPLAVASIVGLFYYGYSPFSLVAGAAIDRIGPRRLLPGAAAVVGMGGKAGIFPPYVLGLVAGIASGAAMLPYTVIKEANPPQFGGTATGVVNFLNFTFSALLGPVFAWILQTVSGGAAQMELQDYQSAFTPLLYGVAIAILLTFVLKETGPAVRATPPTIKESPNETSNWDREIRTTAGAVQEPRAGSNGSGASV